MRAVDQVWSARRRSGEGSSAPGAAALTSVVPPDELARRLCDFRARLRLRGVSAAVIVQTADLYYLSGTAQNAHLVVRADADPILLVRKDLARARRESALDDIRPLHSFRELPRILAAEGIVEGRLGLELDVLPAARYLRYGTLFEGLDLVDCSADLRQVRARKSAWELERIRRAALMIASVGELVAEVVQEGMTELALAAEVERWLRRNGHQGLLRMRSFNGEIHYGTIVAGETSAEPGGPDSPVVGLGPNAYVGKGASVRPIRRGEPIVVDLVGACEGYAADQTRTYSLGPLADPRLAQAHEAARKILRRVEELAAPGSSCSQLYDDAVATAERLTPVEFASASRVSFIGHGIGLEIDEHPFLARGSQDVLEEGMVFAVEPKFFIPGVGAVGVENSYAVSSESLERLTTAPEELLELS